MILMVGPYVLSSNRWVKRKFGYKELVLVFFSPYYTIPKIKYDSITSALPFLRTFPVKIPLLLLQAKISQPEFFSDIN